MTTPGEPHKPPGGAAAGAPIGGRNRLGEETSPYLLQHRDNPVHWWAWGPEALAAARDQDKPILLSVGYAACHWCHVMAHECFENPAIAHVMNQLFINIKVDREERPDLDMIYQRALAVLGQQGGWPLTMFLKPDGEPFFGGTYFPPSPRYNRPGFPQVLDSLAQMWRTRRAEIDTQAGQIMGQLDQMFRSQAVAGPGARITHSALDQAAVAFTRRMDPFHGGLTGAPKFPQVPIFRRVFQSWRRTGQEPMIQAIRTTLTAIAQGGIYDHLGGGFARYSVDDEWLVPHFEKMLYDNASLIELLADVWRVDGTPLYAERIAATVAWLQREMIADNGAFASALDADSEGEEGKFYVWSAAEIRRILGDDDAALFALHYDVTEHGNFEGHTVLNRRLRPDPADAETERRLAAMRARLLEARAERVRPQRDDKVLADWNGLMIAALVRAADTFAQEQWRALAAQAMGVVLRDLALAQDTDGGEATLRLHHSWCAGRAAHPGTLEDHANLARAALDLYQSTGDAGWLAQAQALARTCDRWFWDAAEGGYFLTASDVADVIRRPKDVRDDATPNGNGTMVEVLHRLWQVTGDAPWRQRRDQLIASFAAELSRNLFGLGTFLNAIEAVLADALLVLVIPDGADAAALEAVLRGPLPVGLSILRVRDTGHLPAGHPAAGKTALDARATAYYCREMTCSLPVTEAAALRDLLAGSARPA